ncbi:hypothetical protein GH714_026016 [Hevea brasiliensis]|uniref:Uncharacterized protein n=1 Tax=Hevea brasiliensis TaxID=3981 RepID=A0A6A6KUC0_HEVBR|nr:hypothetical protein GH714_026016 [Hevea brasiliensis]
MKIDYNHGEDTDQILERAKEGQTREEGVRDDTEAVIDEVVEGVAITIVCELVVGGRKFLEALSCYACKVAGELRKLCQNHRPSRHEAVDQRLLPHLLRQQNPNPRERKREGTEDRSFWLSFTEKDIYSNACVLGMVEGSRETSSINGRLQFRSPF